MKHKLTIIIFGLAFFFPLSAWADVPSTLDVGLVGHWTFDGKDMRVNVADSSGQGNHGALSGFTSTTTIAGKLGQALQSAGGSRYVGFPAISSLSLSSATDEKTISAWIKTSAADAAIFGGRGGNGNPVMDLELGNNGANNGGTGVPSLLVRDDGGVGLSTVTGSQAINDNRWHLVTVIITSAKNMYLYVDGVQVASGSHTMTGATTLTAANTRLGSESINGSITPIVGALDDVRIYNRALSAAEVKQLYNSSASAVNATVNIPMIDQGLVGHWTFDGKDMRANVIDSSGQGNNGSLINYKATTTAPGKIGQGLSFNGRNNYVSIPSVSSLNITGTITVSAWVKLNSLSSQRFVAKWNSSATWLLEDTGSVYKFWVDAPGSGTVGASTAVGHETGKWHLVTGTYDGALINIYVDGVFQASQAQTGAISTNSHAVYMGTGENNNIQWLNGIEDDVRIYNRALSATEVKQLYGSTASTANTTVNIPSIDTGGLIAHWTFDGKDMRQNVTDSSGQGNNGNLVGYTATTSVPGKIGQALSFNGTNNYVLSSNVSSSLNNANPLTVSVWFKATVPGVIVDETTSGWHDSWIEVLAGGTLKVSVWNCSAVTVGTVSFGAWNHVVLTYAAGSLGGALNGVTATPNVCTRSTPGGGTLYYALGLADGTNMGSGAYFTGAMDDVRIYTRALGAAEVTQLYTAAKARLR